MKYIITGKVFTTDEKFEKERRVQYYLFMQVLEVETGQILFQNKAALTKAIHSEVSARPEAAGMRCALVVLLALASAGCAGHAAHTAEARSALDAGDPARALAHYNDELGVKSGKDLPEKTSGKHALYVLDRSMIQQQLEDYAMSSRDLEVADKEVEMLDLKRSTMDDIGKYMFSDDTGPYKAPPYEKLLINTMNIVNYLERHDLSGAKVEARRFSILHDYLEQSEYVAPSMAAPGAFLAGFAFEKAGDPDLALRYYDEALAYGDFTSLLEPVRRLTAGTSPRGEHIQAFLARHAGATSVPTPTEQSPSPAGGAAGGPPAAPTPAERPAEVLVVISYGRVPRQSRTTHPHRPGPDLGRDLSVAGDEHERQ